MFFIDKCIRQNKKQMIHKLNLSYFISKKIIKRNVSMFKSDLDLNIKSLTNSIQDKSILVIGGAGTIGSSFIKASLKYNPSKLYVVDTNENGLTELTRDLRSSKNLKIPNDFKTYPINFSNSIFYEMLKEVGPFDIVANFAAHKHVRSEKDKYSVAALIENNITSAIKLLDYLKDNPPNHFFCVSTDKAANPVNVMGASKKIMEDMIFSYSKSFKITTARFANVAFSNGSLLDGYINRLIKKQPLVAPKEIKRFFVSPEESGQICLLACILGKSGEIFFPKLREADMLYFTDICDSFLKYLGLNPIYCGEEDEAIDFEIKSDSDNYPVYYFDSNTTGEKLFEEFYSDNEIIDFKTYKSLGVIKANYDNQISKINSLIASISNGNNSVISKSLVVKYLKDYLVNFDHNELGKNLDDKI